jgi:hypothetical protein
MILVSTNVCSHVWHVCDVLRKSSINTTNLTKSLVSPIRCPRLYYYNWERI